MNTHYERIGGEAAIHALVERFYALMDTLDEAEEIRAMHAEDLSGAKDKLFKFLSGWMGGPQLYMEEFGHPRLRQRHMPFPINESARDQWMLCMRRAMEETGVDPQLRAELEKSFYKTADFMRNKMQQ